MNGRISLIIFFLILYIVEIDTATGFLLSSYKVDNLNEIKQQEGRNIYSITESDYKDIEQSYDSNKDNDVRSFLNGYTEINYNKKSIETRLKELEVKRV